MRGPEAMLPGREPFPATTNPRRKRYDIPHTHMPQCPKI
ncbi:MAG: hypothetical protein AVDCRST_MAG68-5685 [uncultured Gemmatimonadetes bacterium]|uniref:Uncharacterized protein n=1 Tax=uncultured Gemmatimonadota bacterium TaxID=203437 RepID=A0A6J4MVM2_9BACT|nr:MAG: hypothetical protein AVDCRST_MAG68-5685 [uncultured Gemmatimonadota bacterium]